MFQVGYALPCDIWTQTTQLQVLNKEQLNYDEVLWLGNVALLPSTALSAAMEPCHMVWVIHQTLL